MVLVEVGLGFDAAGYLQGIAPGRTDRGWNRCGGMVADRRAHSDAMVLPDGCDAGYVRCEGEGCT